MKRKALSTYITPFSFHSIIFNIDDDIYYYYFNDAMLCVRFVHAYF